MKAPSNGYDAAAAAVASHILTDDAQSKRGPSSAVATELAAEVINNCVRSFVYRCLRKKMARAQHEWKRWMEQRAHRMLARAAQGPGPRKHGCGSGTCGCRPSCSTSPGRLLKD